MTTPGDWIDEVLAALDEQSTGSTAGRALRRAAVLGGMAAVTAAGAASVLVLQHPIAPSPGRLKPSSSSARRLPGRSRPRPC